MNFAEVRFWELLFGGLTLIVATRTLLIRIKPATVGKFDKAALLSLGLFLLLCVSWVTFIIFLAVAVGTYLGLDWILRRDASGRRKYAFVLIPLQLLPLFYYKYANFVVGQMFAVDALRTLVIPVGISFYTFQKVAFVLDTLHFQKPMPRFLDYMNFAGFFPQIVAGPIERRENLLPQMESFRFRWSHEAIDEGAGWIAVGLFFKCCLADNLAIYFDGSSISNAYLIWLANIVFGLRIYYDFAGYSLVALGIARCLGVRLTLNFASPYCATSVTEFWRRWHITLSQWFRDYLYIPLGGSRTRWWAFNVMLVFVVSGIWHGAGWNFLLWGAMHGLFLVVHRVFGSRLRLPMPVAWLITMAASFGAWLAFYELRPAMLLAKLQTLATPAAYQPAAMREALGYYHGSSGFVLGGILLLAIASLGLEWRSLANRDEPYCLLRQPKLLLLIVVLTVAIAPTKHNEFIYFAF